MTSGLPPPQRTAELLEPHEQPKAQPTWTASLASCGCCRTARCRWSAGWAPPGTGSTAAAAAAAACSATGWRRGPGCSSGCHSWSLEGTKRKETCQRLAFMPHCSVARTQPSITACTVRGRYTAHILQGSRCIFLEWSQFSAKRGRTVWFGLPDGSCGKEESTKKNITRFAVHALFYFFLWDKNAL